MRGLLLIALVIFATGAGIAAASVFVGGEGPFETSPDHLVPGPAEAGIGARAPDPAGGPDWAVRTYISRTGRLCAERGRLQGGVFGDLDSSGDFEPRPAGPTGACADPAEDRVVAAVDRLPGHAGQDPTTIVFGASLSRPRAAYISPDGSPVVELEPGTRGSFIAAFPGMRAPETLPLYVEFDNGSTEQFTWSRDVATP